MAQDVQKRDAIRIQVIKCAGLYQPEYKTFSVDPEITNFPMLHNLLSQAFQLQGEFTISYLSRDEKGVEVYLSLLSDWDLDAAFLSASDPVLKLKVDARPFESGPGLDDWDVISMKDTSHRIHHERSMSMPFVGTFMDSVGRTINRVQKIFQGENNGEENVYELPLKPLDDNEFLTYLDEGGRLVNKEGLMLRVFQGGVEPSLRKTVWRHLLNIFPPSMSGEERWRYLKQKDKEYHALKDRLMGNPREDFKNVMNMVRKDVLRTDRLESFYSSGADENPNGLKLFNLLTTYALSHPDISYCQGMSDLASPILYVMQDEAQAYLCFVGLMKRLRGNFLLDGKTMSVKFLHLTELIKVSDPEFYNYLKEENADDLYFCYRWLLLELKREFSFQDSLRMLEVMWSAVPPSNPPQEGIELSGPPTNMSPTAFATDKMRFRFARERSNSRKRSGSFTRMRSASVESDDGLRLSQKESVLNQEDLEVFKEKIDNNYDSGISNHNTNVSPLKTTLIENMQCKGIKDTKSKENMELDTSSDKSDIISPNSSPRRSLPKIPNNCNTSITSPTEETNLRINCNTITNGEASPESHSTESHSTAEATVASIPKASSLISTAFCNSDVTLTSNEPETSRVEMSVSSDGEIITSGEDSLVISSGYMSDESKRETCLTSNGEISVSSSGEISVASSNHMVLKTEISLATSGENSVTDRESLTMFTKLPSGNHSLLSSNGDCIPSDTPKSSSSNSPTKTTSLSISCDNKTSKSSNSKLTESSPSDTKDTSLDNLQTTTSSETRSSTPSKNKKKTTTLSSENKNSTPSNNKSASTSKIPFVLSNLEKKIADLAITSKPTNLPLSPQSPQASKSNVTSPMSPTRRPYRGLPTPKDFGMGNPFMMFLCLTLLLEQREYIMAVKMDYNDMAMLFDRMVRKHDLNRMLCKARDMYIDYLKAEISFGYWEENQTNKIESSSAEPQKNPTNKEFTVQTV